MTNNDKQFFPGIPKIKYEGPASTNPLSFRHYNAEEVIYGKKMKDWLRFSVAFWHTFRGDGGDPFGAPTKVCARTGVCVCVCFAGSKTPRFKKRPAASQPAACDTVATNKQPASNKQHANRRTESNKQRTTTIKPQRNSAGRGTTPR